MKITLDLPYLTNASVNSYLGRNRFGGVYMKDDVKVWGQILVNAINRVLPMGYNPEQLMAIPFHLDVEVKFPKKFGKRSGDAPNYDKVPRDFVAAGLGVDDVGTTGEPSATYGHGKEARIILHIRINYKKKYGNHPEQSLVVADY